MKKTAFALALVICFATFNSFTISNSAKDGKVNWISISEAIELSKKEPRKIIVDIYADWCGWCKKMDKTTFKHEAVVQYVGEKFYAVRLDAEDKNTLNFKGKTYKYVKQGKAGANELALELMKNRVELPATVILDEKYRHLSLFPGYLDAHDLDLILHYYTTSAYQKRVPIGIFAQNYKSTIKRSDLSQF